MRPILLDMPALGLSLRSYEVCVALALLLGWVLSLSSAKEDRLPPETMGVAYLLAVLCGVLGARGLWLLQHPDAFTGPLNLIQLQAGAMALFGGLIAGAAATSVYAKRQGVPVSAWFDCLGPALLAGMAMESLGAFLAGTDFGLYAPDLAWGVRFGPGSPAQMFHRATLDGLVAPDGPSVPVHPTQLYGVFLAVVGFTAARALRAKRSFSGQVAAFCFGWFALSRMVILDFFTARRQSIELGGVDLNLAAGVFFVIVAAFAYRSLSLRQQRSQDPAASQLWRGGPWTPSVERDSAQPRAS